MGLQNVTTLFHEYNCEMTLSLLVEIIEFFLYLPPTLPAVHNALKLEKIVIFFNFASDLTLL